MTIKTLNHEQFLDTFQNYFDVSVGSARINHYKGANHLTVYYDNEDYSNPNDIRIMAMDFRENKQVITLSVRIPLNNNFEKEQGLILNNPIIKKQIEKAKSYYPVFKIVTTSDGYSKSEYNGKPYLIIKCDVEIIEEQNHALYKISNEIYKFEVSFNIQANGNSNNCDDFITYVEKFLEKYFLKQNVDIEGMDYKQKLELYHMITI